jgi:hypothetical protein
MEIAIPLLVLGGMYVVSNQKKDQKQQPPMEEIHLEGFDQQQQQSKQPIPPPPPQAQQTQPYSKTLLNGTEFKPNEFYHNNMVPFNGGKVRGRPFDEFKNDSVLDNKSGQGSHYIVKKEQAPLFGPSDFSTMIHGSQNQSDFLQSRVVLPARQNNVKPVESQLVAPGLGKGYGTEGFGGFNAGLQSREQWMPKSVDELRVQTNPKMEYNLDGLQGPAMSSIKAVNTPEVLGTIEKRRPETSYANDPSRWLTTTGVQKETTSRPIQQLGNCKRNDGDINYQGPATSTTNYASYTNPHFEAPKKTNLPAAPVICPSVSQYKNNDMPQQSCTNYQNNRSVNPQPVALGVVGGIMKAILAPVNHIFKPTLKEETIKNARIFGDAKSIVAKSYNSSYIEPLKPTIKETTLHEPRTYVNNQKEGFRVYNEQRPNQTQREVTSESDYVGGALCKSGSRLYDNAYNQTNNDIRSITVENRTNMGGTQIFQPTVNMTMPTKQVKETRIPTPYASTYLSTTSTDTMGVYQLKRDVEDTSHERLDSNLLASFRENPYTHSLSSVA